MFVVKARYVLTAILFLIAPCAAFPQSIDKTLIEINKSRDKECRPSETLISTLVSQIYQAANQNTESTEISRGLTALSRETFWSSADTRTSLKTLIAVGRKRPDLQPMIASAMASARGDLKSLVFKNLNNPDGMIQDLETLAETNSGLESPNRFYVAQIKLTLAEYLSDYAFENATKLKLPIPIPSESSTQSTNDEIQKIEKYLKKSIKLFEELSGFYENEFKQGELYSRNVGTDFRYQVALLKFAISDDSWIDDLEALAGETQRSELYASNLPVNHIFVYRFLAAPFLPVEEVSIPATIGECSPLARSIGTRSQEYDNARVERFFNPVQLSLHTCSVLRSEPSFESARALSARLSRFQNSDYRVILGHYRGEKIRFSFFTKSELIAHAKAALASITEEEYRANDFDIDSSCDFVASEEWFEPEVNTVSVQNTGKNRGYVYVGENLNFIQAKKLRNFISRNSDLEEAYVLRPKI